MQRTTPRQKLAEAELELQERFRPVMVVNQDLNRAMVSQPVQAQAHGDPARWFRYREGFSPRLVEYLLRRLNLTGGTLLEPMAGSGTTLFAAQGQGMDAVGIELLPSAVATVAARKIALGRDQGQLAAGIETFAQQRPWQSPGPSVPFAHLPITKGAFPRETENALGRYRHEVQQLANSPQLRQLLEFAAMCVLEEVSYTQKDGQLLRWDTRAERNRVNTNPFHKGPLPSFDTAVSAKLGQMIDDMTGRGTLFGNPPPGNGLPGQVQIIQGSALNLLPTMTPGAFDAVITSPPYLNRYDYTRTYALELAMLGTSNEELAQLRQAMLCCTVENREKTALLATSDGGRAARATREQELLQLVLACLEECLQQHQLNNNNIPRLVRNYFTELTALIFGASRLLKPGAPMVVVNDNVRYQGIHIPVDLILCDLADAAGFDTEHLWVLPTGKGNSPQQMGRHGREENRKCVYVWRRREAP